MSQKLLEWFKQVIKNNPENNYVFDLIYNITKNPKGISFKFYLKWFLEDDKIVSYDFTSVVKDWMMTSLTTRLFVYEDFCLILRSIFSNVGTTDMKDIEENLRKQFESFVWNSENLYINFIKE